jgi:N-acetylgalactosamine kinase
LNSIGNFIAVDIEIFFIEIKVQQITNQQQLFIMDMFVVPKKLSDESDDTRILELGDFFTREYCLRPQFFIKVPGRVNIIGEHVDYCGYPVLPLAISQNILLAVAPADNDILQLKNIDSSKYKSYKCNINSVKIEKPEPNSYPRYLN